MCGAIVGAASYSLPPETRHRPVRHLVHLLSLNLGRIVSYASAGAAIGWFGAAAVTLGRSDWLAEVFRLGATTVLIGVGLHLAGWLPALAAIERAGIPVWRRLEPLGRRLLPLTSPTGALLFGLVWGWLPCGLVYSMLLSTPAQASATTGALYMASFGLGTLPLTLTSGAAALRLRGWCGDPRRRAVAGLALIALALFSAWWQFDPGYSDGV